MPNDPYRPPMDGARRMARVMIIGLWLLFLGFGTWFAALWLDGRAAADRPLLVTADGEAVGIELAADGRGHFTVQGEANGQAVDFLVDTGASQISVPERVADRLGLERGRRFTVNTANGSIEVRATRIDTLSVGSLTRHDVDAHINPGLDGDFALLGMNFLQHYELLQRDGRLSIREPGRRD